MTRRFAWLSAVLLACAPATPTRAPAYPQPPPSAAAERPPTARTVDVVENLFGHELEDPYRWMEGDDNAELDAWLRAQGDYARGRLARLPERDSLWQRIRSLGLGTSTASDLQIAGGRIFYQRLDPPPPMAAEAVPAVNAKAACDSDRDCSAVADYCRGCSCRALARGEPEPSCKEPKVACFVSPCLGRRAVCRAHACVLEKKAADAAM